MTAAESPYGQPHAFQYAVRCDGIEGVLRTTGIEAAARPEQWTDQQLVAADQQPERQLYQRAQVAEILSHNCCSPCCNCWLDASRAWVRAPITMSTGGS